MNLPDHEVEDVDPTPETSEKNPYHQPISQR